MTKYTSFCVDTSVPVKTVLFSNIKPWDTKNIKAALGEKKTVFGSGEREVISRLQRQLSVSIREVKMA